MASRRSVALGAALTFGLAGCGSSAVGNGGRAQAGSAVPSTTAAAQAGRSDATVVLLRADDLPRGWSVVSDALPPGSSINNGGPVGRSQVATCADTPHRAALSVEVSDDYGQGNSRAWDVVVDTEDTKAVFEQMASLTMPPPGGTSSSIDCFVGVAASETLQVRPDLLGGGALTFGSATPAPTDLGSYGRRTASQEVTVPLTKDGRQSRAYLDVAVVELPHQVVAFGFFGSDRPVSADVIHHVLDSVTARAT